NDLAAHLYLDKSTASRVVDGLERKGLARRGAHPQDGRAVLLSATPAGTRLCRDRKSTRLNSSHVKISYAVFCLKKKKTINTTTQCGPVCRRLLWVFASLETSAAMLSCRTDWILSLMH